MLSKPDVILLIVWYISHPITKMKVTLKYGMVCGGGVGLVSREEK